MKNTIKYFWSVLLTLFCIMEIALISNHLIINWKMQFIIFIAMIITFFGINYAIKNKKF